MDIEDRAILETKAVIQDFSVHVPGIVQHERDCLKTEQGLSPRRLEQSLCILQHWSDEASRASAPLQFAYGAKMAELYVVSERVNLATTTMVIEQIENAPLIAKLGFNYYMRKTTLPIRVCYYSGLDDAHSQIH